MPRLRPLQATFTSGEQDPLLIGRRDLKHYYAGAEYMRNVWAKPQGGWGRRPGLRYVSTLPNVLTAYDLSSATITAANDTGSTVSNLTDDDEATDLQTTAIGTTDDFVVFHIDFGSSQTIQFIDLVNFSLDGGSSEDEFKLQTSPDNAVWTDLAEAFPTMDTTERTFRRGPFTARYVRCIRDGSTDLTTNGANLGEVRCWTNSATLSAHRELGFEFSTTQSYILVFTDRNMRVFRNGVFAVDIVTPYTTADLYTIDVVQDEITSINWVQDLDTLLVVHPDHAPRQFKREGEHYEWQSTPWVLNNIPQFDYGSGSEDVWSVTRGYPVSATFFQGRLYFAGSKSRPQTTWASKPGDFNDFNVGTGGVDDAIDVTADTDDVAAFRNIFVGRHLQYFASSSEFYVPISESEAVTPENIELRRTTQRGSASGPRVFDVDGATFFLQRRRGTVREFIFTDTEGAYQANPVSLLSSHLIVTPHEMAYRQATDTDDADYVFVTNSDGTLAVFCTLRSQDINAWTLSETDGKFKSVAVDVDEIYTVVERTIDGVDYQFLEVFDDELEIDCGVKGGAASSASVAHLAEATVQIVLDDAVQEDQTATGGSVTFIRAADTSYQVGLEFPDVKKLEYDRLIASGFAQEDASQKIWRNGSKTTGDGDHVWVRTMPIEGELPDGTTVGLKKRVVETTTTVKDTRHLIVNDNEIAIRRFGSDLTDKPVPLRSGDLVASGMLGWNDHGQVDYTQRQPLPLEVLTVAMKVAV